MAADSGMELGDYLRVVRRRKWLIALAVVIVVAVAMLSAKLQTPKYTAVASIVIQPSATDALFNQSNGSQSVDVTDVATEIQLVRSQPVKEAVAQLLGAAPAVSVSEVGQTDVVDITATNTRPQAAASIANAYAQSYVGFRRTQDVNNQLAAATQIQTRITALQSQIDAVDAQITSGGASAEAALGPQADNLIEEQGAFKQQLGELQVEASLNTGEAEVVTSATAPGSPSSPRPQRDAVIALAVGLILGLGLAFLADYFDDSIRSKDDLDRTGHGLPSLGLVPMVSSWRARGDAVVVSIADPTSAATEAYRALRTSIQFASLERPIQVLQITSPAAAEGKSTTLANLGVALAQAGQEVIVACCDLRRPRLHEFFGLDNSIGFTSVLLGEVPLSAALQNVPGVPGLRLLASGPLPPNPSELLSSRRAAEVLTAARAQADMVLVDSPPTLPVTDAAVLSARVDATLVVVTVGVTTKKQLARTLELLAQVDAPVIGTVLNGVRSDGSYGYGYGYGYGRYERYGQPVEPAPPHVTGPAPEPARPGAYLAE